MQCQTIISTAPQHRSPHLYFQVTYRYSTDVSFGFTAPPFDAANGEGNGRKVCAPTSLESEECYAVPLSIPQDDMKKMNATLSPYLLSCLSKYPNLWTRHLSLVPADLQPLTAHPPTVAPKRQQEAGGSGLRVEGSGKASSSPIWYHLVRSFLPPIKRVHAIPALNVPHMYIYNP
jgi:hypothetical protein